MSRASAMVGTKTIRTKKLMRRARIAHDDLRLVRTLPVERRESATSPPERYLRQRTAQRPGLESQRPRSIRRRSGL
jgi:hypothetical protein